MIQKKCEMIICGLNKEGICASVVIDPKNCDLKDRLKSKKDTKRWVA